jgi:predicted DNA-binding transcriptional regulator AlpA
MNQPEPFLTIEQVCERYGFARQMLATMRYEKRGPRYYKPSAKVIRYKASDIDAWLEGAAVEAAAA